MNLTYAYLYLTAGFLVLIYFLKGIKRENRVSSLLFWRDLYKDKSTFYFHLKFSPDKMFFIQLLILLLLVTALLQPILIKKGVLDNRVIIIMDRSASMRAKDVTPDRFSMAAEKAVQQIEGLSDGVEVALITAEKNPDLLSNFSTDHEAIINKIKQLRPVDLEVDLARTLNMARALYNEDNEYRVIFYSDGVFHEDSETVQNLFADSGNIELVRIGDSIGNIAITGFDVRKKSGLSGEYEFFLKISNNSRERAVVPITIRTADSVEGTDSGQEIYQERITMDPEETRDRTYSFSFDKLTFLQFNLEIDDSLLLDNSCKAVLGGEVNEDFNVLLVSKGNYFLESSLEVIPEVKLYREVSSGSSNNLDLIIFDNILANIIQDGLEGYSGDTMFIGAVPPWIDGETVSSINSNDNISYWDRSNSIFRFVDLQGLQVRNYSVIKDDFNSQQMGEVLLSTPEGPIALARTEPEKQSVFLGFSFENSNLPLQPGFPLLISNLLSWYSPDKFMPGRKHISTGEAYYFSANRGRKPVSVVDPAGRESTIVRGTDSFIVNNSFYKGIYTISNQTERKDYFAVNFLSEGESDLRESYDFTAVNQETEIGLRTYQLWQYIVILVLLLLLIEWYLYHQPELWLTVSGGVSNEYSN